MEELEHEKLILELQLLCIDEESKKRKDQKRIDTGLKDSVGNKVFIGNQIK